jgi:hypothetical protein
MLALSRSIPVGRDAHLRWAFCAALAFGIAALLGGNSAQAESCGHYVKRLGPDFVPGKAAAEKVAAENAAEEAAHEMPAHSPCGCRGPECHPAPLEPTPLTPNLPTRIPAPQEITSLAERDFVIGQPSHWLLGQHSCRPLSGYPLRLDRPPAVAL